MVFFPLNNPPHPSPVVSVNMISAMSHETSAKEKSVVDFTPLSNFEEIYQAIQSIVDDSTINDHIVVACDPYHLLYLVRSSPLPSLYYLLQPLPSDESIMEVMYLDEIP